MFYLHAGNGKNIRQMDIVGIFDLDTASMKAETRRFLVRAENEKRLVNIKQALPKAFIVTDKGTVYISQISSQVLCERTKTV